MYGKEDSFQDASNSHSRISKCISNVKYTEERGYTHWRYGWLNIEDIVGIVAADRKSYKTFVRAPTMYVKIKWIGISSEDLALWRKNCSWITRSDLLRMVGRVSGGIRIQRAWQEQEERFQRNDSADFKSS